MAAQVLRVLAANFAPQDCPFMRPAAAETRDRTVADHSLGSSANRSGGAAYSVALTHDHWQLLSSVAQGQTARMSSSLRAVLLLVPPAGRLDSHN